VSVFRTLRDLVCELMAVRSDKTVKSYAVAVVITLLITLLILVNIRTIANGIEEIREITIHGTDSKMMDSGHKFWRDKAQALEKEHGHNTGDQQVPIPQSSDAVNPRRTIAPASKFWYLCFWVSYAVVMFPATRVALALEALSLTKGYEVHNLGMTRQTSGHDKNTSVKVGKSSSPHGRKMDVRYDEQFEGGGNGLLENQKAADKDGKHDEKTSDKSKPSFLIRTFHVIVGLLVLPIFAVAHAILFMVWNIKDLLVYLIGTSAPDAANKKISKKPPTTEHVYVATILSRPVRLKEIWSYKPDSITGTGNGGDAVSTHSGVTHGELDVEAQVPKRNSI
jgi:hypothetical protein